MSKKYSTIIIVIIFVALVAYVVMKKPTTSNLPISQENPPVTTGSELVSFKNSEYSPQFSYPNSWGEVSVEKGNSTCPEEDTYRTSDSVTVSEWQYLFSNIKLSGSESFIRVGILVHGINPKKKNNCGDDFLLKIASKEVNPETISSFPLSNITTQAGLSGAYNPNASRLNTEFRRQYTFFIPAVSGFTVVQPYFSFIPYFGSPELAEMEDIFKGDMNAYIEKGQTSAPIRSHLADFTKMADTLTFQGE